MELINTDQERGTDFPLEKVGIYHFSNNRMDELINSFILFTQDMEEETKSRVIKWIVTTLYEENFNFTEAKKFATTVGDVKIAELIYSDYENNKSLYSFEKEVMDTIAVNNRKNKEYYTQGMIRFSDIIVTASITDDISTQIDEDEYVTIDIINKIVKLDYQKKYKKRQTERKGKMLLTIAPIRVVEYSTSPKNPKPLFRWSFEDSMGVRFTTKPQSLKDTVTMLKEHGYVVQTKNLQGTVNACLLALKQTHDKRCYSKRPPLLAKGFHYIDGEIICEDYDLTDPTDEEIIKAIETLEEYKTWFIEEEYPYLATVFKWGLFAPFNYAYKTKNNTHFQRWLYLHGEGRVGKTNGYGKFVSHLWFDELQEHFNNYKNSFDTVPRFRNLVSKDTFPVLMNETADTLEKKAELKEMYKTCVEGLTIGKNYGDNANVYEAYSSAICTSNGYLSDESGAIAGRTISLVFSQKMSEAKQGKDIEFDKKWKIGNPLSPLNNLRAISHTFAHILIGNPKLLNGNWESVTNEILRKIFEKVNKDLPEWLEEWVNNENSYLVQVNETRQDMMESIQQIINRYRLPQSAEKDPFLFVKPILEQRLIVGLYMKKDGYVYLTQKFLNNLYSKRLIENPQKLSQFAESYNWQYENKTQYIAKGVKMKACKKPFDIFINEVYDLDFEEQIDIL